eukprot:2675231-Rhodomonas_salina.3
MGRLRSEPVCQEKLHLSGVYPRPALRQCSPAKFLQRAVGITTCEPEACGTVRVCAPQHALRFSHGDDV